MSALGKAQVIDQGDSVCIIGSGAGGLSAARALKAQNIAYDQFERHADVGGIWDIHNSGTPMYESAHFISSRDLSGFVGYPMPRDYPDYPSHRQIAHYLRSFADAFGLREAIQFNTSVSLIEKDSEKRWLVTLSDGVVKRYRWIILATGTNWKPSLPSFRGEFNGEIRHSNTFKSGREFQGKRVVVVGAGNSGADISCEAAIHADQAFISMRRGYYFIPKHVFGMPVDKFNEGPHLPLWLARPVFKGLLRLLVGDLTRWGLPKPDHALFETHPIINSQLLHHLQHGNIAVRKNIDRFEGDFVVFEDGAREQVDLVLCATGYKWGAECAEALFEWKNGRPLMYLSMFSRICSIDSDAHGLFSVPYRRDRLIVAMRNDHPLASFDEVAFLQTLKYDQIGLHSASSINNRIHAEAKALGEPLRLRIHVPGFDAVCRMVQANMGIGILPLKAFELFGRGLGLTAVHLSDEWSNRTLMLLVRDRESLSPVSRLLFDHLQQSQP